MKEKLVEMKDVFHFDEPGTLPPPGPIGRLVRLAWGLGLGVLLAGRPIYYRNRTKRWIHHRNL